MAAVLLVAAVAIGLVAVQVVTRSMTERVDAQLRDFSSRMEHPPPGSKPGDGPQPPDDDADDQYRQFAVIYVDESDGARRSDPAGYPDDPAPLPDIPPGLSADGKIHTVESTDGSLTYHAIAVDTENGRIITAASMSDVDNMRRTVLVAMTVTVVVVLVIAVTAAWWITRSGLRPVDEMIDDAVAVAHGDLDRRIQPRGRRTELGRLSAALNRMVSHLVEAIAARDTEHSRLRRFVADASHELRTPLAVVGGYAQLYRRGQLPPGEKLDRAWDRVYSENRRLTDLVDDLMLLSRLDSGAEPERELIDLSILAREVVTDAEAVDAGHPIRLDAREVVVSGDETRLHQVVTNLVTNARVHTPKGTAITITVDSIGDRARLTVADTGPGIPARHREKIFDRFYRTDASRSRDTGGSGLGLAIVESIMESHGGAVRLADTDRPGTTVVITLPLADPAPPDVSRFDNPDPPSPE